MNQANLTSSHFAFQFDPDESPSSLGGGKNHKEKDKKKANKGGGKMAGDPKHNRGLMTMGADMMGQMGLDNMNLQNMNMDAIRKELEGPMPLRVMCGLAGVALTVASCLGMLNLPALITHPARFLLQIYEAVFGLLICGIELKDAPWHSKAKDAAYKWFPFLTVIGGKGAFYIFVGSLGAAFGWVNLLVFIPAMAVLACGVILVLFHFGKCKTLGQKYDMTVVHATMTATTTQLDDTHDDY